MEPSFDALSPTEAKNLISSPTVGFSLIIGTGIEMQWACQEILYLVTNQEGLGRSQIGWHRAWSIEHRVNSRSGFLLCAFY